MQKQAAHPPCVAALLEAIERVTALYHRLVLFVSPAGTGKTAVLHTVSHTTGASLLNVNLALSSRMLDLTERQRALQVHRLLTELISVEKGDVVLLDNIEILFEASLKQDPLRLLQGLSRNRTVVASWGGHVDDGQLVYAIPGHPEHRRYPVSDLTIVWPVADK